MEAKSKAAAQQIILHLRQSGLLLFLLALLRYLKMMHDLQRLSLQRYAIRIRFRYSEEAKLGEAVLA